jgi:enamine deaminase RidA (YjgF/YER057c/UK114 family)
VCSAALPSSTRSRNALKFPSVVITTHPCQRRDDETQIWYLFQNYSNGSSSPAISVGDYVFVSGLTASTDGGLKPQFDEVVAGLKALLAQADMTIKNG